MATTVRRAGQADAPLLHRLAAATFALACPPGTTREAIADFIHTTLSEESFVGYLADPERVLLISEVDGDPAGYTMLVFAEPSDDDVAAVVSAHPAAELSKVYVLEGHHGAGVGAALMAASLAVARDRGVAGVWLGVNQLNARANRFYEKNGFTIVGEKKFLVGGKAEDDFVRERVF
jgi:ribosomal protein S18 acetylase RimI-like enzyme